MPDFPWDTLAQAKKTASAHPDGIVDLSVGTPVDPTPADIQRALRAAADAPGYPPVVGTSQVKDAIGVWMDRRGMIEVPAEGRIPTIGSKEMVAWLPLALGVRPGDTVLVPEPAYPTYEVGVRLAGGTPVAVDPTDTSNWPDEAAMVWLNSPSNPTGAVMSTAELAAVVQWAREHGAVVAADECYAELAWQEPYLDGVPSLLHPEVCAGRADNLLVLYSLSKQSNLAGYRAGVIVGDPHLLDSVVEVRKHAGMMVPAPVQAAMSVALEDERHVAQQRAIYERRRNVLASAVSKVGLQADPDTKAGLYLWLQGPENEQGERPTGRQLVDWLAYHGILVAPGDFYGEGAANHVRMALTATDERVDQAASRLEQTDLALPQM